MSRRLGPILPLLAAFLDASEGPVLARWDFDEAQPFHHLAIEGEPPVVVPDPLDPANHVMQAVLRPRAERPERSEVRFDQILEGQERWVGCRILRPDAGQFHRVCLFQLGPISGAPGHGGRGLYQLLGWKSGDRLSWSFKGYLSRMGGQDFDEAVGPVAVGTWDDWVMHLRLSAGSDGCIELWRNGSKILGHSGANALPGDHLAVKWGIYIGAGNVADETTRVYYDDVVIADGSANFADVSPGRRAERLPRGNDLEKPDTAPRP